MQLNREQLLSLGALCLFVFACLFTVGLALEDRSEAASELAERRSFLERLIATSSAAVKRGQIPTAAPQTAFIDAPTAGLAAAKLQERVSQLASGQQAVVISLGVDPQRREDAGDLIRVQSILEIEQGSLQVLLYQMESQTPYIFIDSLTVQPVNMAGQRTAEYPSLRITMTLRALWRRGST